MTAIWQHNLDGWRLLSPSGFPDELALHGLVEQAPQILPLAGNPRLVVVGREVNLGGNSADLVAIEPDGRLVIVEIKLAKNAEARRAVVAQILTYAAYFRGLDLETLELGILGSHLHKRGFARLSEAAASSAQNGSFDEGAFEQGLRESLGQGRFRSVLVLDDAPPELVRLVGYLEAVADKLLIDLITVAAYDLGGTQIVVPQRVEPERASPPVAVASMPKNDSVEIFAEGAEAFVASVDKVSAGHEPQMGRLLTWAATLENAGIAKLVTFLGKSGYASLRPFVLGESIGLVTIIFDKGPVLCMYRSVFERRAPRSLAFIDQRSDLPKIGNGRYTREISDELLVELTNAYREAAEGRLKPD